MKKLEQFLVTVSMVIVVLVLGSSFVSADDGPLSYGVLSYEIIDGEITILGTGDFTGGCDEIPTPDLDITELDIPAEINGYPVTKIGANAFNGYENLQSVSISDGIISIGDYAFFGCTSLENITIPDSVTSIGVSAFTNTAYNSNADNWEKGVLYIDNHLISANSKMPEIYEIKDGTITIADYAFGNANQVLKSLVIPDSVLTIGKSFLNLAVSQSSSRPCIENIVIGKNVRTIGDSAFSGCSNLSCITIPDSVTYIGNSAFFECNNLKGTITIPDGVTTIYGGTFYGCNNLKGVIIGNNVTTIGVSKLIDGSYRGAFENCTSLESIIIPDSVTKIEDYAFAGCTSLKSVSGFASVSYIDDTVFENAPIEEIYINNPECVIEYDGKTIPADAVIYGYANSPAQKYAQLYMRNFVAIATVECAHTFGEWIVDEEVSCTEKGFTHRICSLCNAYEFDVLDATGHFDDDNNNICDNCDKILAQSFVDKIVAFFEKFTLLFKNFFEKIFGTKR